MFVLFQFALLLSLMLVPLSAHAATYYVQNSPSVAATNCTQSQDIATPHDTIAEGVACLSAGDTLYLRGGTYTQSINLMSPTVKTGTAGNPITIAGYPGEEVIIRYTEATVNGIGGLRMRGNIRYIVVQDIKIDGVNYANGVGLQLRDGNSDITLRRVEIYNQFYNGIYLDNTNNVLIDNVYAHDMRTDCVKAAATGHRWQGVYAHHGTNLTVQNSRFEHVPAQGIRVDPGPWNGVTIKGNVIVNSNYCPENVNAAMVIGTVGTGGTVQNVTVSDNVIAHNGYPYLTFEGGYGGGMKVIRLTNPITNLKINNNVIYDNVAPSDAPGSTESGWGLQFISGVPTSTEIKNNLFMDNEEGALRNVNLTGITISNNACTGALFCGATNKVTLTTVGQCLVDAANSDFRLIQGTNPCRDAGATVTTRPSPVGVTDIGPFEQGEVVAATVVEGIIELTINAITGVTPTSGITGLTLNCGTCTGTPVLTGALKAGSTNTVQVSTSGLTGSGTGTINLGSTNMADSSYLGPASNGMSQGINSVSALAVTGTIDNTGDPTPEPTGLYSEFLLADGSGTTATDTSGNTNHGTVSSGVTWVATGAGVLDTGITVPTDATYRHVASTHGAGVNVASNSLSYCAVVKPDLQYSQKIPLSSGDYSSNRRAYVGWATSGGVTYWGQGVQSSSLIASGVTEFPVVAAPTLICQRFNAATDIANLSVNRTIGTSAAANKAYTSFALVEDIRAGNDGTNTINNGGVTIYGLWVWNDTYISDAEVQALYDSIFPAGGAVGGYEQKTYGWEGIYTYNGSVVSRGTAGQAAKAVAGGGIASVFQFDCTGGACNPLAVRFYYSTDCVNYDLPIPTTLGGAGIALWGDDTSSIYNKGEAECCLTGALTETNGPTLITTATSPTVELAEDASYTIRVPLRFAADKAGSSFCVKAKQDNGAELDTPATGAQIDVVPMSWSR